ncbi:MAG: hypothetical protein LBV53_01860 [Mycoplasmataceae bacterium]|nr:hypothetical protein [Mycoplasmataceae bacterium]
MAKNNSSSYPESSNMKLLNILLTIFVGVIVGFIVYMCTKDKMNDPDKKTCRLILWIFFILEIVFIFIIIIIAVTTSLWANWHFVT